MRVGLVGWEIDEGVAGALAGLGLEVIAYTRWHEGLPYRHAFGGWILERCPHRVGGGTPAEEASFRESIASRDATYYGMSSSGYDVVHALDRSSLPAATALAESSPWAARIRSGTAADAAKSAFGGRSIYDHPAVADSANDPFAAVVPSVASVRRGVGATTPSTDSTSVVVWVPRGSGIDGSAVVASLTALRDDVPELAVTVLGEGIMAESLRHGLARQGLTVKGPNGGPMEPGARWNSAVSGSRVVLVPGSRPSTDAAVQSARALGVSVLTLGAMEPKALTASLLSLFRGRSRADRVRRVASALAIRCLEPGGVAAGWLDVYLDTLAGASPPPRSEVPAWLPGTGRSRVQVVPVSSMEAWASWHVNRRDWDRAAEWLGEDATSASLVLRLWDISAIAFQGANAHRDWDQELQFGERTRLLRLDRSGLSLAVALGVRSARGIFLPLARASLLHLPPDDPSQHPATRRLGILPRRGL